MKISDIKLYAKRILKDKYSMLNIYVCSCLLFSCLASMGVISLFGANSTASYAGISAGAEENGRKISVTVDLPYSGSFCIDTSRCTVAELVSDLNIELDGDDILSHSKDSAISENMNLVIYDVEYKTVTVNESIPFSTVIENVQTVPRGTTKLQTQGKNGTVQKTIEQKYINGELVEQCVISEALICEPQDEIYHSGIGGTFVGKDGKEYAYSYYVDVIATAYEEGGLTATGHPALEGVIAVDPKVIPLRSKVYVVGDYGDYGVQMAYDTGGSIKGKKIDLCLAGSIDFLLEFGVRSMRAYVLED